jgi:hypothetical protein
MTARIIIFVAVMLGFGAISGAWAQSSFTTGTAESNARAGFGPGGYGGGLYDYAPGYRYGYAHRRRY